MIAICRSSPEGVFNGFRAARGGGWRAYGLCPKLGSAARAPRIPSMISICGGSLRGFLMVPVVIMSPFWPGMALFGMCVCGGGL